MWNGVYIPEEAVEERVEGSLSPKCSESIVPFQEFQPGENTILPPVEDFRREYTLSFLLTSVLLLTNEHCRALMVREGATPAPDKLGKKSQRQKTKRSRDRSAPMSKDAKERLAKAFSVHIAERLAQIETQNKAHSLSYPSRPPNISQEELDRIMAHISEDDKHQILSAVYAESSLYAALVGSELISIDACDRFELSYRLLLKFRAGKGESFVKSSTAYWAAKLLEQELPPVEGPPKLYGGLTHVRLKRIISVEKKFYLKARVAQGFLFAKRATHVVSKGLVRGEYVSHCKRLISEPKPLPSWFRKNIARTIAEVFPRAKNGARWTPSDSFLVPSERAHFGMSCREGGALGGLLYTEEDRELYKEARPCEPSSIEGCLESALTRLHSKEFLGFKARGPYVSEVRGYGQQMCERLLECYRFADVGIETPYAAPSAVLEACKVRMITKGPARLQWLGKYLQKFLWGTVSQHPTFELIGKPLTTEHLEKLLQLTPQGSKWLSGDYKAATDYISSLATTETWDAICERANIEPFWAGIGHKLLTDHTLVYPKEVRKDLPGQKLEHDQANGQLMGSVISFPILCLINACMNRYVMEQAYERSFTLVETGMLINGDDCMLHLPERYYGFWKECATAVGLIMSVGKNYFSDKFMVINSRMFVRSTNSAFFCDTEFGVGRWLGPMVRPVPFLNPGNLHGVGRVMGSEDSASGFLSRCSALVETGRGKQREDLIRTWVYLNGSRLKTLKSRACWYLPTWCGGFGLPKPAAFSWEHVTIEQRKIVRFVCNRTDQSFEWCTALETGGSPAYVTSGGQEIQRICKDLRIKPTLVSEDTREEYLRLEDQRTTFTQFVLGGFWKVEARLKNSFAQLARAAEKTTPGLGFPSFERRVLRFELDLPKVKFDWAGFRTKVEIGYWCS